MIADGVGRGGWGEAASRLAIEVVASAMLHNIRSYHTPDETTERAFLSSLETAAMQCQANIEQRAWENAGAQGMATGYVIWVGVWPRAYILHSGTSRIYALADGKLIRLDAGANDVSGTRSGHLSRPTALIATQAWNRVGLMCSKGLTNNVSEDQICRRLKSARSAKQACEELLEDALAAGGSENITLVVGRTRPAP
jgi:protein phosphatase